jgi:hypothetical protein
VNGEMMRKRETSARSDTPAASMMRGMD